MNNETKLTKQKAERKQQKLENNSTFTDQELSRDYLNFPFEGLASRLMENNSEIVLIDTINIFVSHEYGDEPQDENAIIYGLKSELKGFENYFIVFLDRLYSRPSLEMVGFLLGAIDEKYCVPEPAVVQG